MSSIACFARRLGCALVLAALPLSSTSSLAAPPGNKPGTTPQKKIWPCLGQTTRPADKLIQMQAGKSFYKETVSTTPVTTPPQFESGALSVAQAKAASCTRRVIELRVPASTSSGCSDCYPNAEISVGAGTFANSKEFEEYFHVPKSSVSKADCETFKHQIEVFRKPRHRRVSHHEPAEVQGRCARYGHRRGIREATMNCQRRLRSLRGRCCCVQTASSGRRGFV